MSDFVEYAIVVVVACVAINVFNRFVCWLAIEWWKDPLRPLRWLCGFTPVKPLEETSRK